MLGEDPPAAMYREGDLMLGALLRDLAEIGGVRVTTTRDARLSPRRSGQVANEFFHGVEICRLGGNDSLEHCLPGLLDAADAFWMIAPETDGILASLCRLGEHSGCLSLNSSVTAVGCAASKLRTIVRLEQSGLLCVPGWTAAQCRSPGWRERTAGRVPEQVVLKPDDGVGCENMRLVTVSQAPLMIRDSEMAQPYVSGAAASLSLLYGDGSCRLVGVNKQEIEYRDGQFSLRACVVNGLRDKTGELALLGQRIGEAIPGLAGYVGVDYLMCDDGIRIVEVNPRLTVSYAGLRRSLGVNPAACVLAMLARTFAPVNDPVMPELESASAIRVSL